MKIVQNLFKVSFLLVFLSSLFGCGYETLVGNKFEKFSIEKINVDGNARLSRNLANNLTIPKNEKKEIQLIFDIFSKKSRKVSDRDSAGKIKEYTVYLTFDVTVMNNKNKDILVKRIFNESGSYKASTLYLDTLNSEKKIINNLIVSIADEITKELSLIK